MSLLPLAALALLLFSGTAIGAAPGPDRQSESAALQQAVRDGERALKEKRYADAEKAFEALRRMSPETPEVHARLGLIYFQQGRFSEAVNPLREAVRLNPKLPRVDVLLAMSLSELGRYEEALGGLAKGFEQRDDGVLRRMVGLHLQRAYTGLGKDREAVAVALELSRLHPDDPEVLYHTGRLFANFAYLQTMKLAKVAPDSTWMHQAAGEANESQGLYDAALEEYRQVLALAPRRPGVHFRIGRTLLARARAAGSPEDARDGAMQAFEEELRIDPSNANASYELAELHRKDASLDRAREYFERALAHHPEFENARVGLGRTLIALGRPVQALPHLEAVSTRNPANAVALYQLAQAYAAIGRTADQERALAALARVREPAESSSALPAVRADVSPQEIDTPPRR